MSPVDILIPIQFETKSNTEKLLEELAATTVNLATAARPSPPIWPCQLSSYDFDRV